MSIFKDSFSSTIATAFMGLSAFVVSLITSWIFGADSQTDNFYLTLALIAIFTSGVTAAMKAVLVPVMIDTDRSKQENENFLGSLYFTVLITSLSLFVTINLFAPQIINLVSSSEDMESKILLLREMSFLVIFSTFIALLSSIYNSLFRFVLPIISPLLRIFGLLIFVLLTYSWLGIHSLSIGTVIGEFLQLIVLIFILKQNKMYIGLKASIHPDVKKIIHLSKPPVISNILLEAIPLVDRVMIASLAVGSVTAISLANRMFEIPMFLISSGGFLAVILSHWSKFKAQGGAPKVMDSMKELTPVLSIIFIPFIVYFIAFANDIVKLFYNYGEFDSSDVALTANLLQILLISCFPLIISRLCTRVFHVFQDTKTPFWVGIFRLLINIVGNFIFREIWGPAGIAISTSLATIILTGAQLRIITNRFQISLAIIYKTILRHLMVAFLSVLLIMVVSNILWTSKVSKLSLFGSLATSFTLYFCICLSVLNLISTSDSKIIKTAFKNFSRKQ